MNRCRDFVVRVACAGLFVLAFGGSAAAGDGLAVQLEDAETGETVRALACAVLDPARGTVRFRFSGAERAPEPVRAGDRLYVYAQGYDLLVVDLDEGQQAVTGELTPCVDRCTVRLADGGGVRLHVTHVARGFRADGPVRGQVQHDLGDRELTMLLPRGISTSFVVEGAEGELYWPFVNYPKPGGEIVVRRDSARQLRVRLPDGLRMQAVDCFPDFALQPEADPLRIDAWRWRLNRPGWLRQPFSEARETVPVLPDVAFHLFARVDRAPIYRYVTPSTADIDLRRPEFRAVARRPVIDGAPTDPGTLVAPGRLNLFVLAELVYGERWGEGLCLRACALDEDWGAPLLPAADWLTVWDRVRGVAYLRWNDGAALEGAREPGAVDVVVPERLEARGTVSLIPVWKGARTVSTFPPDGPLRRPFEGRRLRFRGIPPGHYAMNIAVDLADVKSGQDVACARYHEIDVRADVPLVVTLPIRSR